MAEDWDLGAVVRSCYRNPAATSTTRCVAPLENPIIPVSSSPSLAFKQNDKPFDFVNAFGTSTRRRNNGFDELYEVYATFLENSSPRLSVNPNSSTSPTSSFVSRLGGGLNDQPQEQEQAQPINPSSPSININPTMSLVSLGGFNVNVNHPKPQEKLQGEHPQPIKSDITTTIVPPIISSTTFCDSSSKPKPPLFSVFRGFCDGQGDEEEVKKPRLINPKKVSYPVLGGGFSGDDLEEEDKKQVIMTCTNQKTKRQPKNEKRNYECGKQLSPSDINKEDQYYCGGSKMVTSGKQQRRTIRVKVVDGEELVEVDDWNWRKYGRKVIKASPYPRNYYKCCSSTSTSSSTSSGSEGNNKCEAKKYVERCQSDPESFMVTYSGKHNHSLPKKRNCNISIKSLSSTSCTTTTTRRARMKTSTPPTTTTQKAAATASCHQTPKSCSSIENRDDGAVKVKVEVIDEDEDEDEDEDVLVGHQDLGASTTTTGTSADNKSLDWSWGAMSADDFSFVKLLQSPWSPKTSTTTLF